MTSGLNPDIPAHNEFLNWLCVVVIRLELHIEADQKLGRSGFGVQSRKIVIPEYVMFMEPERARHWEAFRRECSKLP